MPHPRNAYAPGDHPPDLVGQVDRRIRSRLDGRHLPDPAELFQPLVAALRAAVAGPPPAHPNALADDQEVFQQAVRYFLANELARTQDVFVLHSKLPGCALAAVDPHDPLYGTRGMAQIAPVVYGPVDALLGPLVDAWYTAPLVLRPEDAVVALFKRFDTLAAFTAQGNQDALGLAYLADHPQSPAFRPVLTQQAGEALADALRKLDAVGTALEGAAKVPLQPGVRARWSTEPLVDTAESDLDTEKSSLVVEKAVPETVRSIRTALHAVSNLCGPAVHQYLPLPRFTVHKALGRDSNIRAYNDAGDVTITIGQHDRPDVVAHEVGHVVENVLPVGCWLDIVRLLHARHAAAGGGTLLALYPKDPDPEVAAECAYRAVMPAYPARSSTTGSYAAKTYGGFCPTEVLSTTLQLLVSPQGAKTLLTSDPQVLAVVLRWLLGEQALRNVVSGQLLAMAVPTALP
ncbi:hypothetical protein [Streptomyces sp. NPDC008150]|uniref:hypothetical protein n=1 Tax=Streptomyces sp. NPDC008150 TaxID=3364816 RepID=UPI0036EA49D3